MPSFTVGPMQRLTPRRGEQTLPVCPRPQSAVSNLRVPGLALAALTFSSFLLFSPRARSQNAPPQSGPADQKAGAADQELDGWGRVIKPLPKDRKSAPAPRRDISGVWDPGLRGIGIAGAEAAPEDGSPEHQPPYTPLGLEALNRSKPNGGARGVLPADSNDPVFSCDPQGMPREDLYELRTLQIFQTPQKTAILYQFGKVWRVIWSDGRELPKDAEPRWYGYSVGKWVDDYTFVVETTGTDDRTWVDRAGRPHSDELRVEERFRRPDRDHLELTVTLDDPKMYTKPWVALDKFVFDLEPSTFDVREMICSPSEFVRYNRLIGNTPSDANSH